MNLRIKFNKNNEAKYISHLDLLRTFNRMIMRSSLKPAYSQGYNPHIIMSFLQPSSVGMATKSDCLDISVLGEYDLDFVLKNLNLKALVTTHNELILIAREPSIGVSFIWNNG